MNDLHAWAVRALTDRNLDVRNAHLLAQPTLADMRPPHDEEEGNAEADADRGSGRGAGRDRLPALLSRRSPRRASVTVHAVVTALLSAGLVLAAIVVLVTRP